MRICKVLLPATFLCTIALSCLAPSRCASFSVLQGSAAQTPPEQKPKADAKDEQSKGKSDPQRLNGEKGDSPALQAGSLLNTVLFALGLTLLISLIEIPNKSKTGLQASWRSGPFFLYFMVLAIGNAIAAILSSITFQLPPRLSPLGSFMHAFFGVFAFQGVMSNTNITFLDKGVLTIQDWIEKARDSAVAVAVERQARDQQQNRSRIAMALMELDEGKLDAFIDNHLGRPVFESIAAAAAVHKANGKLYKALEFATRDPSNASAIAKGLLRK